MHIIRSMFIALSNYSAIPMPQFLWKEEDMRYTLCFFPLVGLIIGIAECVWFVLAEALGAGDLMFALIGTAIPLIITGGFHVDGYMDVSDALSSHQTPERKREILKDSHIGAFAVIRIILYYLVYIAAFSELRSMRQILVISLGFILTRTQSGLAAMHFPKAGGGTLAGMSDASAKKTGTVILFAEMAVTIILMAAVSPAEGAAAAVAAEAVLLWYYYMSRKEFGGVSGDLAGYYVTAAEQMIVVCAAFAGLIMKHFAA